MSYFNLSPTQLDALRVAGTGKNISWPLYQSRTIVKLNNLSLIVWNAHLGRWDLTDAGREELAKHGQ